MDSKVVHQIAGKLGLMGEANIIEKTMELLRLLQLKGSSLPRIGDYAKCIFCLDLSTSLYGHEFDAQTALKLSGFKKPSYLNNRRIIEKVLDLSKPMGIAEICVQLSLTEIQETSQRLLDNFVSSSDFRNVDTTHPQYAAMVVYQLCRLKKIKIQKSKLISFSHLRPSQWSVLEKSWEMWAKKNVEQLKEFQSSSTLRKTNGGTGGNHTREPNTNEEDQSSNGLMKTATDAMEEEYADWKERVLKRAFEDLARMKGN